MLQRVDVRMDRGGRSINVGTAFFESRGRIFSTQFQYSASYLADPKAYALDPALPLTSRAISTEGLPGAFRDSAPDLWGRNLVDREHRATGTIGQPPLTEANYLLRASDYAREGNLRYLVDGVFVDQRPEIPKLIDLPELLQKSDRVATDDTELGAIKRLLDAGSSTLGGARPKASVLVDNRLHVAKFPSPTDDFNVIAWEMTALDLARLAGIQVPS